METELAERQEPEPVEGWPWERERQRTTLGIAAGAIGGALVAASLFVFPPVLVAAVVGGIAYLVLLLANPFAGLLGYLACEFLRFGELVPSLTVHIQRLAILPVLGSWLLQRALRRGLPVVADRQNSTMLALLAVALLSMLNPFDVGQSFKYALGFVKLCLVYLCLINLTNTRARIRYLFWTLALLTGALAGMGIWRYHMGTATMIYGDMPRAGALLVAYSNPNVLARVVVWAMPYAVYLLRTGRAGARLVALGLLGAYGWSLVCTGSRGGLVALLAVAVGVWLTSRRKLLTLTVLVVAMSVGWSVAPQAYRDRVHSIVTREDPDGSFAGRVAAWKAASQMIRDYPLLGAGAGNFLTAYGKRYTPPGIPPQYRSAHSIWFETAGELGWVGLMALGWLLWTLLRGLVRLRREAADAELRAAAEAVLISAIGLLVAGTFASILWEPHLYLLAGLGTVLGEAQRRAQEAA